MAAHRIAFLGTPTPAVPALQAFIESDLFDVVTVITNPDRPSGRGHKLRPPPVKVVASDAGIDVWQPVKPSSCLPQLKELKLDAAAVVAYGSILSASVLDATTHGFVNLHFSLLPAWRGAAPVTASILNGDDKTGVTCFKLDPGMDTGPVLSTYQTRIAADETAGELTERLAIAGAGVLVEAVAGLIDGSAPLVEQDHTQATYASKFAPENAAITWTDSAEVIDRMVRAFNPMPGAHTTFNDTRLKLHRVTPVSAHGVPGHVVEVVDGAPVVACGSGGVRLDQVQPAGKPRISGADFVNGYRPEVLG